MFELSLINLLIVDRSPLAIERIVQILNTVGYTVQALHSDQQAEIQNLIQYQPIDVIMVRQGENLPKVEEVRAYVTLAVQDIPILAIVDDPAKQSPVDMLRAGADNFFYLSEPDHLVIAVAKELHHLRIRKESHSQEIKLKESEARSHALLENSRDAIAYIHEGTHSYANPAYLRLFGYTDDKGMDGVTLMNLVAPSDRDKLKSFLRESTKAGKSLSPLELIGLDRGGKQFPIHIECALTPMDEEPCLQIYIRNPARLANNAQDLDGFSKLDALSGLYNRKFFTQHLDQILAKGGEVEGALLYILLTDYRSLSEQLGLEAVDQLVIDLAKLLQSMVSAKAVTARFSDAVFTLYTPEASSQDVLQFGERICAAVKAHVTHVAHRTITSSSSIGICMVQKNYENAMQLLAQADRICEIARQMGGNQVQIYPPLSKPVEPSQEERITGLIQDAMSNERLSLLFQPIASFQGDTVERYKAYLRILGEDKKPLPMNTLGPLAESRGHMRRLDRWVVIRGLQTISERYQKTGKATTLFIRVSQNSVVDDSFYDWLEKRLKDIGVKGSALVIEVAEQCAEHYLLETKRLREQLQRIGCGLALSHCSGEATTERMLNLLVPDYLKLDGSVIEKFTKGRDEASRQAFAALTEQAQVRNSALVAAGVATAPQMASIWQFNVTLVQGDMVQETSAQMNFDFQQFAG